MGTRVTGKLRSHKRPPLHAQARLRAPVSSPHAPIQHVTIDIPRRGRCAFICNYEIICPICRLPVPANVRHECEVSERSKVVRNDPDW